MATLRDLAPKWRLFAAAYPWRRIDPVPFAPLRGPLAESRLAVVSSAGFVVPGQSAFDTRALAGDPTFREIPADVDVRTLQESHRSTSFDHAGIRADPNLGFPVDRVRELVLMGRIGSVNRRHFSMMGSLTATMRLVRHTAPEVARALREDGVDVALLVPV